MTKEVLDQEREDAIVAGQTGFVPDHDGSAVSYLEPALPGMPEAPDRRPYNNAVALMTTTLALVEAEIEQKVEQRATINAEIKVLRDEHDRLTRMKRIAEASK
jgi:hypothetical protein